jgi:hypothetical protein
MASGEGKVRDERWRVLVGSVAVGAAVIGASLGGVATATTGSTDEPSSTAVVECSSGILTEGEVQTSSLSVAKVAANEHPDIPGGCTVLTG